MGNHIEGQSLRMSRFKRINLLCQFKGLSPVSYHELETDLKAAVQVLYHYILDTKVENPNFQTGIYRWRQGKGVKRQEFGCYHFVLSFCAKLFCYFLHSFPLVSAACIQTSQNVTPKQVKKIQQLYNQIIKHNSSIYKNLTSVLYQVSKFPIIAGHVSL